MRHAPTIVGSLADCSCCARRVLQVRHRTTAGEVVVRACEFCDQLRPLSDLEVEKA